MVGRKDRIKVEGIGEKEYKALYVIAAVASIIVVILSLNRTLASSWVIRSFLTGLLSTILVYYSTLKKNIKFVLLLIIWVILAYLAVSNITFASKLVLSLAVLLLSIYAWMKRPLPKEKAVKNKGINKN